MTDLGSIYGTTVGSSNTLVIDFSYVDICGNLNVHGNLDCQSDCFFRKVKNTKYWASDPYFNGDKLMMHEKDLYIAAPAVHIGNYMDATTSLHWDYPHNDAGGYTRIFFNAKTITASTQSAPWSDDRIKHFEKDIVNSLITIRKLKPMKYTKTFKIYPDNYNGPIDEEGQLEAGFIAQEVLKIPDLSYCVIDEYINNDGKVEVPYTLRYNDLFVYNVAATKELDTIVQRQQTEIEELKNENTLLKNALNTLLSEAGKPTI